MEVADEQSTDFYILREAYKLFLPQNGSCRDGYIAYINIICLVTGRSYLIGRYLLHGGNDLIVLIFRWLVYIYMCVCKNIIKLHFREVLLLMLENVLNPVSLNNVSGQSEKRYRSHPIELNPWPVF